MTPTPSATPTAKPSPPDIHLRRLDVDGAVIEWDPNAVENVSIVGFEMSWTPSTPAGPPMPVSLSHDSIQYKIQDIQAKVRYVIQLVAIYDDGYRATGEAEMVFDVPVKPEAILEAMSATSVNVMWHHTDMQIGVLKRPINSYELSWRRADSNDPPQLISFGPDVVSHVVENLQAGTPYDFALRAANGLGFSEASIGEVTTLRPSVTSTPTPTATATHTATPTPTATRSPNLSPLEIEFSELDRTDAVISWDLREGIETDVERFELSWSPATTGAPPMPVHLPPAAREYAIPNAEARVRYTIALDTIDRQGVNHPGTLYLMLEVPRNPIVAATMISTSSLRITWDHNQDPDDVLQRPVTRYEISWRLAVAGSIPELVFLNATRVFTFWTT